MTERTSTMRHLRLALALIASLTAVAATGAAPAGAVRTQTLFVSKTQPAKATFGPIPANFPPAGVGHTPPNCGHPIGTNRFERTCDNVPLTIEDPNLGPTEDYLVTVTVTWTPNEQVKDPDQHDTAGVNDLDIYLYDDRQIRRREVKSCDTPTATAASEKDNPDTKKDETDTASCFTLVGQSAGSVQPETFKLFSPEPLTNYNLVIVNFAGPNLSYTVEADMKLESFDAPFEDLGPTFAGRRTNRADDGSSNFVAPVDLSGDDAPSLSGGRDLSGGGTGDAAGTTDASLEDVGGILAGGRTLPEVPILPDADFSTPLRGTAEDLRAPPSGETSGASRTIARVGPVSPVLVAFWLVVVPLVLLGVGVVWLLRRSRQSFAFA